MNNKYFPLKNARKYVTVYYPKLFTETIYVPLEADENGKYKVRLLEVPTTVDKGAQFNPAIDGMVETKSLFLAESQFLIDYDNGYIYFHPAKAGKTLEIMYYGIGSTVNADDMNYLNDKIEYVINALPNIEIDGGEF